MEPMGSITGDNYENDRHVLLNQTTDENIALFESLYGHNAAVREFQKTNPHNSHWMRYLDEDFKRTPEQKKAAFAEMRQNPQQHIFGVDRKHDEQVLNQYGGDAVTGNYATYWNEDGSRAASPQQDQRALWNEVTNNTQQQVMPQKSLSNPVYNRPGEPQGRLSPAEHYSRQGTQQPRMQDSRNTAFLETEMGNIDDDDLFALIANPNQENQMTFDANYGRGSAKYFLEQEQSGYEVGSENQMHMRGPFSSETLGPQGRLYGNTPATMQQPKPLPNHQAMPSTMQPRLRPPVLEHEPNALSKLAPRR